MGQVGEVAGGLVMEGFPSEDGDFEMNVLRDGEPVERGDVKLSMADACWNSRWCQFWSHGKKETVGERGS